MRSDGTSQESGGKGGGGEVQAGKEQQKDNCPELQRNTGRGGTAEEYRRKGRKKRYENKRQNLRTE